MVRMTMSTERRGTERFSKEIPVSLSQDETDLRFIVYSCNISNSGLMCYSKKEFTLCTKVRLFLLLRDEMGNSKDFECDGVVVRCEPSKDDPGLL